MFFGIKALTPQKFNELIPKMAISKAGVTFSKAHHFGALFFKFFRGVRTEICRKTRGLHLTATFPISQRAAVTHRTEFGIVSPQCST